MLKFLIELEGCVLDPAPVQFEAHRSVTAAVGWSALDQATFWRLTRTKGREAPILPGARPGKVKEYYDQFDAHLETDALVDRYSGFRDIKNVLARIRKHAALGSITLGKNIDARHRLLTRRGLIETLVHVDRLSDDPRRRPQELAGLAGKEDVAIVLAATDSLIRAAGVAGQWAIGISGGNCTPARLHQSGAGIVFKELGELAVSLEMGAKDLIQAGVPRSAFMPYTQ